MSFGNAVIGALRVNLSIDTAEFRDGLKSMQTGMAAAGKKMQAIGATLTTRVSAPLATLGAGIVAAVSGMASSVDELKKSAQVAGAGFEEFQRLAYAAKSVGFEGEKLADIYKDVNDKIGDFNATGGGAMKDFFDNIAPKVNITAEAFRNLSGPQALQLYYDSLVKAGASQADMTFYMEAIASDATALIPLLAEGGRGFRELGEGAAVLSEQDAAGLKAYNDGMRALGEAIKALTIALATSGVLEFATDMVNGLAQLVQMLAQSNPEILKWGVVVGGLATALGPVIAGLGLFLTAVSAISAPVLAVIAGVAALTAAVIAFWPEIQQLWGWMKNLTGVFVELHTQAIGAVIEKLATMKSALTDYARQVVGDFTQAFIDLHVRMYEIGGQIIDGLINGIKAKWDGLKESVRSIAAYIPNIFRQETDTHSPSRIMHAIGEDIMQGLQNGMQSIDVKSGVVDTAKDIQNSFQGIGSSIGAALAGTKEWSDVLKDVLRQLASSALSSLSTGLGGGGIGNFFTGILGGLFGFARGGTILPGGPGGGIDSQLVAFRKSPNERVDITKPGQTLSSGRGGVADVRVFVDQEGNWQAAVERISDGRVANAAPVLLGRASQTVVPTMAAYQRDKAGSDWRS